MVNLGYVLSDTNNQLVGISTPYGGMYMYGNGTATPIRAASKYHLVENFGTGAVNKWTFDAGSNGEVADTADNGSGKLRITTGAAHGLVTNEIVSINGLTTAAQNAVTRVTNIGETTFDCQDINYATADETGYWNQGSSLKAGTGAAGVYLANLSCSMTSAGNNKKYNWELYQNATELNNISITRMVATGADEDAVAASGMITIAEGDYITFAVEGLTDDTDLTMINANVNLHKIN